MYKRAVLMTLLISFLTLHTRGYAEQTDSSDASYTKSKLIKLATLEWPPYSSKSLPGGGKTVAKVVAAFRHMGYTVKIDFLPWSRAVRSTYGEQPLYLGYFPEYPLTDTHFLLSASLGDSIVGLVQHKNRKLNISNTLSLTQYRLGVVQDYVNTKDIDDLIAKGKIKPVIAIDDRQNLVRVLNGDIDVAVIDKHVMQYLLQHDLQLSKNAAGLLEFDDTLAQTISLHIAFSRYHPDAALYHKFNTALFQLKQQNPAN